MRTYGKEIIIDIHMCEAAPFSREMIEDYCIRLCEIVDMERGTLHFWDYKGYPEDYAAAPPHLKGISAIQFIKTSNITIHSLDDMKRVYLNIFSCKDFDENTVMDFSTKFFQGIAVNSEVVERV